MTPRLADAVAFAVRAHGTQTRKGGGVPYVSHLLAVAGLVLEAGGDEDMAIAGLLHDSLEDTPTTSAEIEAAFGRRVAAIVEGCTDTEENPKPPWRPRKERYIAHLRAADTPAEVLVVSRADKLHNAQSICGTSATSAPASGAASTPARRSSSGTSAPWSTSSPSGSRVR